ncbi:S-layer homology domain-containing protein [uncultured Treponema sp.]|uniref:S-layer homology domain-containing protein n=1 Tax=uncultured Treponema sp. TaxID=162155 RepID=UPI0025D9808D|nr:S-layer homology domain-containing protein [uncultured Treponema sp.]
MYHPSKIRKYPTTASNAGTELPDEFRIYDLDAQRFFPNAIGKWYLVKDSENNFGFVPATCVKDIKMQSQKDEESATAKRNIKQEKEIEKAKTLAIDTSEQEEWKGAPAILRRTPFEFEGGNGTAENPFLIKTAEQLNSIRFGLDFHYKLISDIDLSKWGNWIPIGGTPSYGGSHGGQGFQAADKGSGKFSGSLDGNHHVISGMTIIDHSDDIFMGEDFAERSYALFAEMIRPKDFRQAQNNFVKDLGIINYTIDVSYTKLKNGCTLNAAALSPNASSRTFENCYSSGGKIKIHASRADEQENTLFIYAGGLLSSIDHTKVINCYNTSPLIITTSDTDYIDTQRGSKRMVMAGGIARRAEYSKITGCMNSGEISVPYANWGLAALSAGIVARVGISDAPENIYNLPPETATNITSCYNIGTIRGTYVAGVMGYTGTDCYISDCYNAGNLEIDELNPNKEPSLIIKADIAVPICKIFNYGKKYVHDNGINVVSGNRWIDSPKLGRKILKAIPEDKLGIKPSVPEAPVQVGDFSDVMSNDIFALSVPWAVEKGIAKPSSKTTFSPNEPCTRGQVVTYIYRWQGSPKVSGKNPFKDVKPSDSFYNAALWAYQKGFLEGKTFNGNAPCTRGDALEILWKCSGSMSMIAIDNFTDVPRSSKYQQPVSWAYYGAIAKPTTKTTFEPESVCTKGQIVTFIYQVEHTGLKDWMDTTQKNANSNSSQIEDIYESTLKEMGLEDFLNGNQF